MNNHINAYGVKINLQGMDETLQIIGSYVTTERNTQIQTSVNAAKIVKAQKDLSLMKSINNSNMVNIDGFWVVIALRLMGYKVLERGPGIDLFQNLLKDAAVKGNKVYFLGARQEILEEMIRILLDDYPEIIIAGFRNGYFTKNEEVQIIEEINESDADILFLGIPTPQKEHFLDEHRERLNVNFCMGVGGRF